MVWSQFSIKIIGLPQFEHPPPLSTLPPPPPPPPPPLILKWAIDLTKNPKKREMDKLLKGRGNSKKGGFCMEGGMLLV